MLVLILTARYDVADQVRGRQSGADDYLVITVCDTRLLTMRYGQAILKGLPPFPVVQSMPK